VPSRGPGIPGLSQSRTRRTASGALINPPA